MVDAYESRVIVGACESRVLIGEVYLLDLHRLVEYINTGDELHLAHNFVFFHLPWQAAAFGHRCRNSPNWPSSRRGRPGSWKTMTIPGLRPATRPNREAGSVARGRLPC
ncbi:MAG TPA: hypothetical protein VF070_38810 [Streptosporangiaceae bacterium]